MIKLSDILKEVVEGAKVDFQDDNKTPTAIQISQRPLDGEQLRNNDGSTKKDGFTVYYSMQSNPEAANIKNSQDALKYNAQLINTGDLAKVIGTTLKSVLPKVDYICLLESEGNLNRKLVDIIKGMFPGAEIIPVAKMEYVDIRHAIDWDQYEKESETIKKAIMAYIQKKSKEQGPHKIRKSGETQSSLIQRMHSKYNLGLNPNVQSGELPEVYNKIVECIKKGKTMLVVDDNIHTGTDFLKIFRAVDDLVKKLIEETTKRSESEEAIAKEMEALKLNPKFDKPGIQVKYKELQKLENDYQAAKSKIAIDYGTVRKRIFGYVLYELTNSDLKK